MDLQSYCFTVDRFIGEYKLTGVTVIRVNIVQDYRSVQKCINYMNNAGSVMQFGWRRESVRDVRER